MEERTTGVDPSLPQETVQQFIESDSEQQFYYLQMAWVEMLEAVDLLHTQAYRTKCPVDLAFHKKAEEIKATISKLQTDIRSHAAGEYKDEEFSDLAPEDTERHPDDKQPGD